MTYPFTPDTEKMTQVLCDTHSASYKYIDGDVWWPILSHTARGSTVVILDGTEMETKDRIKLIHRYT